MRERLAIDDDQFRKATYVALFALTVIVFTGAAVRLSDSGLGCPTWPRCYGKVYPPVGLHPFIEFSNRMLAGVTGVITGVVAVLAFTRRNFRRDQAWLALTLPLGVVAQAVLGGFTVREKLAPGFVMGHFLLSMVVLIPTFWLAWRATYPEGSRLRNPDRPMVWLVRGLALLCMATLFAGTAATAAGPHSGGHVGQVIKRLTIKGPNTLEWAVHQHGTVAAFLGVATVFIWLFKRRRKRGPAIDPYEPLTMLGILIAAQGLLGSVQYELKLPGTMVWLHVCLATVTWVVMLWAVAEEGSLAPPDGVESDSAIATIVAEWSQNVPAS